MTRLPEFIIGGAPRSGTTWLYAALDRHPGIYMAKPAKPEPKFFLVDSLFEQGLEHYSRTWFGAVPAGRVAGEKSTDYLESAPAAERIARSLPGVRLIFLLREPVSRAYSNYLWTRMNGLETEDFETALALEPSREQSLPAKLKFARPYSYFSRGLYADLLAPYLERFLSTQILVLKFEDIIDRPRDLLARVHQFLGVAPRAGDAENLGIVNPAERMDSDALSPAVAGALAARYREANLRLERMLDGAFALWP